jgi:tetratricopeptide (TPR) repeat protein
MLRSIPSTSARTILSLALALQLIVLSAGTAHAATPRERRAARAAFEQAQKHYAAERYAEALEGYSEAHRLMPMPAFIFNMAQCQRLMEKHEEALALYERFLEEEPKAENRPMVEGFIQDMATAIAAATPPPPVLTPADDAPEELAALKAPPPEVARPIHEQWWFWTGVGAVVVGGVVTGVALSSSGSPGPTATLGDVSLR